MKKLLYALFAFFLTACGAVDNTNIEATLEIENNAYATTIAEVPVILQSDATQAWATVAASETEAANVRNINDQLLATTAAIAPPTRSVVQQSGPPLSAPQSAPANGNLFSDDNFLLNGVGTSIRQSDGCLIQPRSTFATSVEQIYAGLEASNVNAGIPILAEWYQGTRVVYQFEWIVDRNYDQLCIWFSLTQTDVTFQPGDWSVQLYAAGQQINGAINFAFE